MTPRKAVGIPATFPGTRGVCPVCHNGKRDKRAGVCSNKPTRFFFPYNFLLLFFVYVWVAPFFFALYVPGTDPK